MLKSISDKINNVRKSSLVRGSGTTFILRSFGFFLGYLFVILVSRLYGADAVGVFSLTTTVLLMFTIIGKLGTDTAIVKYISKFLVAQNHNAVKGLYQTVLKLIFFSGISLSLILFFCAEPIALYLFKKPQLTLPFKISAFALLPMMLRFVNSEVYRGYGMIAIYAYAQHVSYFLYALILLGVASLFFNNEHLPIIAYSSGLILLTFSGTWLVNKRILSKASFPINEISAKQLLQTSLPMMLSSSLLLISGWLNTILLGIYANETEVGIFSVALKIATFTSFVLMSVNSVTGPRFATAFHNKDFKALRNHSIKAAQLNFYASLPVFVLIVVFKKFILSLFGNEFITGSFILLILLAGQVINNFAGAVGTFMNMTGNEKIFQRIVLLCTVINCFLCIFLIPEYGMKGAAIASSFYMILWNVITALYIYHKYKIAMWFNPFSKII